MAVLAEATPPTQDPAQARQALEDPDQETRILAAQALSDMGDRGSLGRLDHLAQYDRDEQVRKFAAIAARRIRNPESTRPILRPDGTGGVLVDFQAGAVSRVSLAALRDSVPPTDLPANLFPALLRHLQVAVPGQGNPGGERKEFVEDLNVWILLKDGRQSHLKATPDGAFLLSDHLRWRRDTVLWFQDPGLAALLKQILTAPTPSRYRGRLVWDNILKKHSLSNTAAAVGQGGTIGFHINPAEGRGPEMIEAYLGKDQVLEVTMRCVPGIPGISSASWVVEHYRQVDTELEERPEDVEAGESTTPGGTRIRLACRVERRNVRVGDREQAFWILAESHPREGREPFAYPLLEDDLGKDMIKRFGDKGVPVLVRAELSLEGEAPRKARVLDLHEFGK